MNSFRDLVDAIQENNRINSGKWSDWENPQHIEQIYGVYKRDEFSATTYYFLKALIRDNGENLEHYLTAMDCLEYGYPFKRSGN